PERMGRDLQTEASLRDTCLVEQRDHVVNAIDVLLQEGPERLALGAAEVEWDLVEEVTAPLTGRGWSRRGAVETIPYPLRSAPQLVQRGLEHGLVFRSGGEDLGLFQPYFERHAAVRERRLLVQPGQVQQQLARRVGSMGERGEIMPVDI